MEFTPELFKKAKSTASAAELLAVAVEYGINMTAEKAAVYFAKLHPQTGKIADEELDNVAGGCDSATVSAPKCPVCGQTEQPGGAYGLYACANKNCPEYGKC